MIDDSAYYHFLLKDVCIKSNSTFTVLESKYLKLAHERTINWQNLHHRTIYRTFDPLPNIFVKESLYFVQNETVPQKVKMQYN